VDLSGFLQEHKIIQDAEPQPVIPTLTDVDFLPPITGIPELDNSDSFFDDEF
jgi:hypothetical protein